MKMKKTSKILNIEHDIDLWPWPDYLDIDNLHGFAIKHVKCKTIYWYAPTSFNVDVHVWKYNNRKHIFDHYKGYYTNKEMLYYYKWDDCPPEY